MSLLRSLLPPLIHAYLRFVGLTTRIVVRGENYPRALQAAGERFIYAFWHERQAFLAYSHRGQKVSILVSKSRDGELISRVMRLFGLHASRGSSSRGAQAGTRALLGAAQAGYDIGVTPDGPRGPRREVKAGVLFLAQKLRAPILPITNGLSRRLVIRKSWDRFQLPLPFGRAVIRYAPPLRIGPDDDLRQKAAELKKILDAITESADKEAAQNGHADDL